MTAHQIPPDSPDPDDDRVKLEARLADILDPDDAADAARVVLESGWLPPDQERLRVAAAFVDAARDFGRRAANAAPSPSVARQSGVAIARAEQWRIAAEVLVEFADAYRDAAPLPYASASPRPRGGDA